MAINTNFSLAHIEKLKMYLDSTTATDIMKKRMEAISSVLNKKEGEEGFPTRDGVLRELSFMMKSKDRIVETMGYENYMENFHKAVGFLEKNPEKQLQSPASKYIGYFIDSIPSMSSNQTWYGSRTSTWDYVTTTTSDYFNPDESTPDAETSGPANPEVSATENTVSPTLRDALESLTRALEAGSYNVPPGNLQQGAALQVENFPNIPPIIYQPSTEVQDLADSITIPTITGDHVDTTSVSSTTSASSVDRPTQALLDRIANELDEVMASIGTRR